MLKKNKKIILVVERNLFIFVPRKENLKVKNHFGRNKKLNL